LWQTNPRKLKELGKLLTEGAPDAPPKPKAKTGKGKRRDADDFDECASIETGTPREMPVGGVTLVDEPTAEFGGPHIKTAE
jgi:hypothetical protein